MRARKRHDEPRVCRGGCGQTLFSREGENATSFRKRTTCGAPACVKAARRLALTGGPDICRLSSRAAEVRELRRWPDGVAFADAAVRDGGQGPRLDAAPTASYCGSAAALCVDHRFAGVT